MRRIPPHTSMLLIGLGGSACAGWVERTQSRYCTRRSPLKRLMRLQLVFSAHVAASVGRMQSAILPLPVLASFIRDARRARSFASNCAATPTKEGGLHPPYTDCGAEGNYNGYCSPSKRRADANPPSCYCRCSSVLSGTCHRRAAMHPRRRRIASALRPLRGRRQLQRLLQSLDQSRLRLYLLQQA